MPILADLLIDVSIIPSVFGKHGFGLPGVEASSQSVFYLAVDGKRSVCVQCAICTNTHHGMALQHTRLHKCMCMNVCVKECSSGRPDSLTLFVFNL